MTGLFAMPPVHPGVASQVANGIMQIPSQTAGIFGGAVRHGLQSAGVSKADVRDELHIVEAEAGVIAVIGIAIIVGGALIWSKV